MIRDQLILYNIGQKRLDVRAMIKPVNILYNIGQKRLDVHAMISKRDQLIYYIILDRRD